MGARIPSRQPTQIHGEQLDSRGLALTSRAEQLDLIRRPPESPSHEQRRQAWERFHAANPHVFDLFERFALEAAAKGAGRIGGRLIWERLRWELQVETQGEDWRLNDHHVPFCCRLFISRHPEHRRLFQLRGGV